MAHPRVFFPLCVPRSLNLSALTLESMGEDTKTFLTALHKNDSRDLWDLAFYSQSARTSPFIWPCDSTTRPAGKSRDEEQTPKPTRCSSPASRSLGEHWSGRTCVSLQGFREWL